METLSARAEAQRQDATAASLASGIARAAERLAPLMLTVALILLIGKLVVSADGRFGFDFHGTIWQPARDVLAGRPPYPTPDAQALLARGNPAVYPPAIFLAATPLALVGSVAAAVIWDVAMACCLLAALRLVGVRDWRIYAVVVCSFPFAASMVLGQIDGLLALGAALVWRYRDRPLVSGAGAAGVVATKLFLWPLILWLLVTRRWRAGLAAAAGAAGLIVGAWAVIGFSGFREYPRLLARLSDAFQARGYSPVATGLRFGLSRNEARVLAPLVAIALILLMVWLVRRGFAAHAFCAAVAAGVFASPIVWMHSMLILFVALAVVRPRFSGVWLAPLALWLSQTEPPRAPELAAAQVVLAVLLALALVPDGRSRMSVRASTARP